MLATKGILASAVLIWVYSDVVADPYAEAPPYSPSADWCIEGLPYSNGKERYLPEGAITQVGPYFFRVCQGGNSSSTPDRRVMRYYYNPERVEGLSSIKVMTGLMINSLASWEERLGKTLGSHRLTGEQQIGSARYSTYRYVHTGTGELGRTIYLYMTDTAIGKGDLPSHIINCTEPVVPPYLLQGSCYLTVGYGEIHANLLFLSLSPESPKIPVGRFPSFASDVKRMLETADVTDEYQSLRPKLPFLE